MFSQKVEYALRAVTHLAAESPRARTVEQIAKATKVPPAYLAKLVQELVREGVLNSQRGAGGGVSLVKKPEELTILDVVSAVDPIRRLERCPLDLAAHGTNLCPLHARMDRALASIEAAFRATTLAEVLSEPTQSVPLCDFPMARPAPHG